MKRISLLVWLALLVGQINAQTIPNPDSSSAHVHLSFDDKVNKADAIIEGTVISEVMRGANGFIGPQGNVFSSVEIKISKIFKGEIKDTIIELVMDGGTYPSGEHKGWSANTSYGWLFKGYEGVFFLRKNNSDIQSGKKLQSFFYLRGLTTAFGYQHNPSGFPIVFNGENKFYDLEKEFFQKIESITHIPRKVLALNSFEIENAKKGKK